MVSQQPQKQTLKALFFPIFFESFLVTLIGVIDTAMVSSVGDNAVGSVGAANAYLALVYTLMSIVSVGAAAIMSRYVGADREKTAKKALGISLLFNLSVGGVFSLLFAFLTPSIVTAVKTDPELFDGSVQYMRIVGISCILVAANFVLTAYLRAFGKPKLSLVSSTVGNLFNLGLNALFLSLGFGVFGVGLATLVSRAITLFLSAVFVLRIPTRQDSVNTPVKPSYLLKAVLQIGLPAAGESFMFTIWNSVNVTFINGMGTTAVNTYSYVMQFVSLLACFVAGYAQASSILVGWNIGAGDREAAFKTPDRAFLYGVSIALLANVILIPLSAPILSLVTEDSGILSLTPVIMAIQTVRLFGQMGNNIYGNVLKTASDAKSTLLIGVFIMPLMVFIGSYLLGTVVGLGLIGYWIGAALDEFVRSFLMMARWRSRKWEKKCF